MGNAPLSSPPAPTECRVVIPITTRRRIGTKLYVFPPMQNSATQGAPSRSTTSTAVSVTPATTQDMMGQDSSVVDCALPPQLESTAITPTEYKEKLFELQEVLDNYKGGHAVLALGCTSLLLVVAFFAAYLTPGFWSSPLFHNPGYVAAIAAGVLVIFGVLIRFMRRETRRLLQNVENVYHPWRRQGIRVMMKHVESVGTLYYTSTNGSVYQARASRSNCYCLIMNIVNDDEEGGDNVSLGTVMTDDSD